MSSKFVLRRKAPLLASRVPRSRVPFARPALGLTPLGCGDWGPIGPRSPHGEMES